MKRIGKWFGSSILIVASIIMLLSILSCKQKGKTPDNNKNKTTEKFKIEFEVSPANTATLKAMEGTTPVNSGDKVEKGKTVVFSLDVKDKGYVFEKWETKSELTKKTATGAELVVTGNAKVVAKLKQDDTKKKNKITFSADPAGDGEVTAKLEAENINVLSGVTDVEEGKVVSVTLAIKNKNKKLNKWVSDQLTSITNDNQLTASFTMPGTPVTLKAMLVDNNADTQLSLGELKYKNGENIKDNPEITVENDVDKVKASDFKASFKGHDGEDINFDGEITYEPGPKLQEGENTITLKVPAKPGSYAETTFKIKVFRQATLKPSSLKMHEKDVNMPETGDWTVTVDHDKATVTPANIGAMFTWAGQATPQKLDVTIEPAGGALNAGTVTDITLKVAATPKYKGWTKVVKVTRANPPDVTLVSAEVAGASINKPVSPSTTWTVRVSKNTTTIDTDNVTEVKVKYGQAEATLTKADFTIENGTGFTPGSTKKVTLKIKDKAGAYKGASFEIEVTVEVDEKLTLGELKYKNGQDIKNTLKLEVENDVDTLDKNQFVAKFDGQGTPIAIDEIIYPDGQNGKLKEGDNVIKLKVNGVPGSYAETIITITVTRKILPKHTVTFATNPILTDPATSTAEISAWYMNGTQKVTLTSGSTQVPVGKEVTFSLTISNKSGINQYKFDQWEIEGTTVPAEKQKATPLTWTMPDSELKVTAKLKKMPVVAISKFEVKPVPNGKALYVADILDISGAASEEGKIVELAKGTDKNCKFNVETNIPGANIKYDPPQVGTSEGYKFTTNETLVTVTVGTEGEHVKTVYKFKVKVRTKAEVKLTTLKINNQPLEEDELDEAMNEEGLIIGAKSPCKITWEKDAELFVKVEGNTIQDNTSFPLENTPKTVKITVQDSENNPTETQTYTLVLVKHDAQNIALEDLTINGVQLSQDQLSKAEDENTAPEIKINSIADEDDTEVPLTWKQVAPGVIVRLAVKSGSGYSMGESYFIESKEGSVEVKSKEKLKTSSELIKIAVKTADKSKIYYVKLSYTN